jgi:hypothetical protein
MERPVSQKKFPPPLFIVGSPRSGTTLFSQILNNHSRIGIYHETHFYPLFRPDLHRYGDLRQLTNLKQFIADLREVTRVQGFMTPPAVEDFLGALPEPSFEGVFTALLWLHARKEGKMRGGDKTPGHHAYLDEIMAKFPQSPVIFILRDPRDTILSIQRAFGTSLKGAAWTWNQAFASYRKFSRQVHLVRYEDLVGAPRKTIEAACAFIGEAFEAEMFRFAEHIPHRLTTRPIFKKLVQDVDTESVGGYRRLSPQQVQRIEALCAEGMEALAYPFTIPKPKPAPISPPSKLDFLLDRLRYYGWDWKRWRRGWMRWKIVLRVRLRYVLSLGWLRERG